MQNVKKYLDPSSANYYPTYINNLKALKSSTNPPAGIDAKIATAEANLKTYQTTETQARASITEYQPKIQALISAKDYWGAPEAKKNEYLFIVDEESCQSTGVDWITIANACGAGKWGTSLTIPIANGVYTFANQTITYSAATQTDAVRIWYNKVVLDKLTITDERTYDEAHRDAIQLIPPPQYKDSTDSAGKPIKLKLADQMAGTILESPTVKNCVIKGVNAPLQGIFMSDGLCRNAVISYNDIQVKGAHAISLAGLLSGSLNGNQLREVAPDETGYHFEPHIRLYPLRIGGNMADDGVVCVLGFGSGGSVQYGEVTSDNNALIRYDGKIDPLEVEDLRRELPDTFVKIGVGLTHFNYDTYFSEYSTWTVNDFKTQDSWGYQQMVAWINLRLQEYSSGQRETGSPLPPPSSEQRDTKAYGIIDMLTRAQTALKTASPTFMGTRLADLQETAIRSFSMKRIAIRNGVVEPLVDLGTLNARREAMLKWLLTAEQLGSLEKNPALSVFLNVQMFNVATNLPIPEGTAFTLILESYIYEETPFTYSGKVGKNGLIQVSDIPEGEYTIMIDEAVL